MDVACVCVITNSHIPLGSWGVRGIDVSHDTRTPAHPRAPDAKQLIAEVRDTTCYVYLNGTEVTPPFCVLCGSQSHEHACASTHARDHPQQAHAFIRSRVSNIVHRGRNSTIIVHNDGPSIVKDAQTIASVAPNPIHWVLDVCGTLQDLEKTMHDSEHVTNVVFVEHAPSIAIPQGVWVWLVPNADRPFPDPKIVPDVILHKTGLSMAVWNEFAPRAISVYTGFATPEAAPTPACSHAGEKERYTYVHVCGQSPWKQTDIVLHAWVYMAQHHMLHKDSQLWVVARDGMMRAIDNILEYHGARIDNKSHAVAGVHGLYVYSTWVDDDVITSLFQRASFVVQPSTIEGFGHCMYGPMADRCVPIVQRTPYVVDNLFAGFNCLMTMPCTTNPISQGLVIRTGSEIITKKMHIESQLDVPLFYTDIGEMIRVLQVSQSMTQDTLATMQEQSVATSRRVRDTFCNKTIPLMGGCCESPAPAPTPIQDYLQRYDEVFQPHLHVRANTMREAVRLALEQKNHTSPLLIVETGTSRSYVYDAGGNSTWLWDDLVGMHPSGGHVYSVDISPDSCRHARETVSSRVTVVCSDSVAFLHGFSRVGDIDLLYLDSYDLDWFDIHPSSMHHMMELTTVFANLKPGCVVVVDDAPRDIRYLPPWVAGNDTVVQRYVASPHHGKGEYVATFMKQLGIEPVIHEYQSVYVMPCTH